jgi:hypothetical protein
MKAVGNVKDIGRKQEINVMPQRYCGLSGHNNVGCLGFATTLDGIIQSPWRNQESATCLMSYSSGPKGFL